MSTLLGHDCYYILSEPHVFVPPNLVKIEGERENF